MTSWYNHARQCGVSFAIYILLFWWLNPFEPDPFLIIALVASPGLADLDLKARKPSGTRDPSKHRHWFWHSSLLPILSTVPLFLLGQRFIGIGIVCLGFGVHLLGDLRIAKEKKILGYLIFKWKGDRMSARNTDIYLVVNAAICIILAISILVL